MKNEETCVGASFALLLRVKKRSEEKSSFCIESTQLRFTASEVVIAAFVWFINARGLGQWNKHVESSLLSPLQKKKKNIANQH